MTLRICPACTKGVWPGEARGRLCPHCGHALRISVAARIGLGLLMVALAGGGLVLLGLVLGNIHQNDPPVATSQQP